MFDLEKGVDSLLNLLTIEIEHYWFIVINPIFSLFSEAGVAPLNRIRCRSITSEGKKLKKNILVCPH
jgi:hypothetical protein